MFIVKVLWDRIVCDDGEAHHESLVGPNQNTPKLFKTQAGARRSVGDRWPCFRIVRVDARGNEIGPQSGDRVHAMENILNRIERL